MTEESVAHQQWNFCVISLFSINYKKVPDGRRGQPWDADRFLPSDMTDVNLIMTKKYKKFSVK
jgi:hypothetical protein